MVPVEILDYIFGLLDGDKSSLEACSKVNPSFAKIVERHLYAHLGIVSDFPLSFNDPHAFSCSQLSKLLSENPQVVKYIRSLRLEMNRGSEGMMELTSILPMLSNLERIFLRSWSPVSWPILDELFRKTFIDCLLHLKGLFLDSIGDFPLSILDKCDNLKRLSLYNFYSDPVQQSLCCRLEYLSVKYCRNFLSRLSGLNLRNLRSFVFSPFADRDFDQLQMLFQACSTSLTTLELFLGNFRRSFHHI